MQPGSRAFWLGLLMTGGVVLVLGAAWRSAQIPDIEEAIEVSGPITKTEALEPFSELTIEGPFSVVVEEGEPAIGLAGDEAVQTAVAVDSRGGRLEIYLSHPLVLANAVPIRLKAKDISRLTARGSARVVVKGGLAKTATLEAEDAALIEGDASCGSLTVRATPPAEIDQSAFPCAVSP